MKIDVIYKRASDSDRQVKAIGHHMKELRSQGLASGNLFPDVIETEAYTPRVHPAVRHSYQVVDTFALHERKMEI
jgi:hypothetical protein